MSCLKENNLKPNLKRIVGSEDGAPDLNDNAWKNRALLAEKRIEDLKEALQEALNAVIKKF